MTDVNGVPIIEASAVAEVLPKNAIGIAQVPVELAREACVFELRLRDPGIVRAVGFWLCTPKVLAPGGRGLQQIPMPLLWVECNPDAPLPEKKRVFAFIPSDAPIQPRAGFVAKYIATALHERGAMHLFELVEAST